MCARPEQSSATRDFADHNYVDRGWAIDHGSITANDDHGKSLGESEQALKEAFQPRSPCAPRCGQ
jgi:hypothetical protein